MLNTICLEEYGKDLHLCSNEECFHALMKLVAQKGRDRIVKDNGRKVQESFYPIILLIQESMMKLRKNLHRQEKIFQILKNWKQSRHLVMADLEDLQHASLIQLLTLVLMVTESDLIIILDFLSRCLRMGSRRKCLIHGLVRTAGLFRQMWHTLSISEKSVWFQECMISMCTEKRERISFICLMWRQLMRAS